MATRNPTGSARLGRGLSSLISTPSTPSRDEGGFFECELDRIDPMDGQPRRHFDHEALDELAQSIAEAGIIQPLVVRRGEGDRFVLVAGERRWRAARQAGLSAVPVVVREITDDDAFALALIENIQREDLNPIEEALAYQRLIDEHHFTQAQLAQRVGKNRSTVANALRLLNLPAGVRDFVVNGELSPGHARAVLAVDEPMQPLLAERIITEQLNVRQAEDRARVIKEGGSPDGKRPRAARPASDAAPAPELRPQLKQVERRLVEHFGTRVRILPEREGGGTIEIAWADDDALQAILDVLEI